jgi:hypothetical protein
MAGVSLADIADLLGHKDLATTQIYAKVQLFTSGRCAVKARNALDVSGHPPGDHRLRAASPAPRHFVAPAVAFATAWRRTGL